MHVYPHLELTQKSMSDSAVLGGPALMAEAVANKTKRKRRMWLDYCPSATITIIHLGTGCVAYHERWCRL